MSSCSEDSQQVQLLISTDTTESAPGVAATAPFFLLQLCTYKSRTATNNSINNVNIKRSQRLWGIWIKVKKIMRLINDISSFVLLLMSFETAIKLRTWSVVKTWQVARLAEKFPRLLRTLEKTFATA
jgi:hypothetical protein